MTDSASRRLSEDDASRLWKRAAQLQAEAAQRLEDRSRALAAGDATDPGAPGFGLTEVRDAALGAGISPEFVELALAELGAAGDRAMPSALEGRAARFLGESTESIQVSTVIGASAEAVYDSVQRVLPSGRFGLLLTDTLGDEPLVDGVFVFDVPAMTSSGSAAEFAGKMGSIGAKKIFVTLRKVGVDPPTTELAVRAPLMKGRKTYYLYGMGSTGALGGLGAVLAGGATLGGLAAGAGIGTILTSLALPVVAVGGGIGALTWWGFRAMYRYGLKSAREALAHVLQVVSVNARTKGKFALPGAERPADDLMTL